MEKLKKNVNGVDIECSEEETRQILAEWKEAEDLKMLEKSQENALKIAAEEYKNSARTKLKSLGLDDQEIRILGIHD